MTLDQAIDRDAEIIGKACIEAFNRAGIPTSVAVDDPECLARMIAAIAKVRAIVAAGAPSGFQPLEGDWADRLFSSQADTYAALSALKGDG